MAPGRIWHRNKEWEIGERWAKNRRGWAYGGDDFRAYMQEMLDGVMEGKHQESYSGVAVKKHDEREAQRLFSSGLVKLKLDGSDLPSLKKQRVSPHIASARTLRHIDFQTPTNPPPRERGQPRMALT